MTWLQVVCAEVSAVLLLKAAFHAQLGGKPTLSDRRWYVTMSHCHCIPQFVIWS